MMWTEDNTPKLSRLWVIIAGSRHLANPKVVDDAVTSSGMRLIIGTVVSGGCRGTDTLAERWARANRIETKVYPADWNHLGPKAGPSRNQLMVDHSGALIAIKIDGVESRGTDDVIRRAEARKLPVFVYTVSKSEAFSVT